VNFRFQRGGRSSTIMATVALVAPKKGEVRAGSRRRGEKRKRRGMISSAFAGHRTERRRPGHFLAGPPARREGEEKRSSFPISTPTAQQRITSMASFQAREAEVRGKGGGGSIGQAKKLYEGRRRGGGRREKIAIFFYRGLCSRKRKGGATGLIFRITSRRKSSLRKKEEEIRTYFLPVRLVSEGGEKTSHPQ